MYHDFLGNELFQNTCFYSLLLKNVCWAPIESCTKSNPMSTVEFYSMEAESLLLIPWNIVHTQSSHFDYRLYVFKVNKYYPTRKSSFDNCYKLLRQYRICISKRNEHFFHNVKRLLKFIFLLIYLEIKTYFVFLTMCTFF